MSLQRSVSRTGKIKMKCMFAFLISIFCFFGVLQQHSYAISIGFNVPLVTGDPVTVKVTLDDLETPNSVKVTAEIVGTPIGDISGVFFDLTQNVDTLPLLAINITGNPGGTAATILEGSVNNIGLGANMNGSGQTHFDVGVPFGTSGGM